MLLAIPPVTAMTCSQGEESQAQVLQRSFVARSRLKVLAG